jgi:hypothetical protein
MPSVERFDSLTAHIGGQNSTVEYIYVVSGALTDSEIHAWVLSNTPVLHTITLPGVGILRLPRRGWQATPKGAGYWEVHVEYGNPDFQQEGQTDDATLQFDTTGGTQHITQSRATVAKLAPPGKVAPDFKGAIGVNNDQIEGVDITIPQFNLKITKKLPLAAVSDAYIDVLYKTTGSVNGSDWRVFKQREALFLGASGSIRMADLKWEITYNFAIQKSITAADGIMIGDIGPIEKKGWDYLWVRYEDVVDDASKTLVKKPTAVYIEQVYPEADFSQLGV